MAALAVPFTHVGNWLGRSVGHWLGTVPGDSKAGVIVERRRCDCCESCPCNCVDSEGLWDRYAVTVSGFPDAEFHNFYDLSEVGNRNTITLNGTRQHIPLNEIPYTTETYCTSTIWTELTLQIVNSAPGLGGNGSNCIMTYNGGCYDADGDPICAINEDTGDPCYLQPISCDCTANPPKCCLFADPDPPYPPEIPVPLWENNTSPKGPCIYMLTFDGTRAELYVNLYFNTGPWVNVASSNNWDCHDPAASTWTVSPLLIDHFDALYGIDVSGVTVSVAVGTGAVETTCGPVIDPGEGKMMAMSSASGLFEAIEIGGKAMLVKKGSAESGLAKGKKPLPISRPVTRPDRCEHYLKRTEFRAGCSGWKCKGECAVGLPAVPGKYCQSCESYKVDPDYEGRGPLGWFD